MAATFTTVAVLNRVIYHLVALDQLYRMVYFLFGLGGRGGRRGRLWEKV